MKKLIALEPEVYQALKQGRHEPIEKKILSDLDVQMNEILNSNKTDSEKATLYNQVLQRSNLIRRKSKSKQDKETKLADSAILSKFKKRTRAKKLLEKVKQQKNLTWDQDGTLVLDDRKIPGSSIQKLFESSIKKREPTLPGLNEFESLVWENV